MVAAEARSRLHTSAYRQLHFVSCEFREGILTLHGRVSTWFLKQHAQTLARKVDGVEEINNQLEVAAPPLASSKPLKSWTITSGLEIVNITGP